MKQESPTSKRSKSSEKFNFALIIPEDDYRTNYETHCYDRSLYKCGKCNKRSCKYHKLAKTMDDIEKTNKFEEETMSITHD